MRVAEYGVPTKGKKAIRMQHVFVLDAEKRPLMPCRPARARLLLNQGKAAVFRNFPFTIILQTVRSNAQTALLRLKLDPGSKTTGLVIVNDTTGEIIFAAEITHRGQQVHERLAQRAAIRRSRRSRQTRYRSARFANRRRQAGWLPPSLVSRLANTLTWVVRLRRLCPIGAISQELVKFDMQLMENSKIGGIEYQQGELAGYEIREYLLEKFQRTCAYCGATNVPFEVEHTIPKSRGGSDRVSNLALSCKPCNQAKGNRTAAEFGHPEVQAQIKMALKDAAAVNTTRWALWRLLTALGSPVEAGSGGRTKWNRIRRDLPKTHWLDAACVGISTPARLQSWQSVIPVSIRAQGWQRRQMCLMDRFGFPRTQSKTHSNVQGFKTGDLVRATVPDGAKAGTYIGRVAVRATGRFNITTSGGVIQGINARFCSPLQRGDGYAYQKGARAIRFSTPE